MIERRQCGNCDEKVTFHFTYLSRPVADITGLLGNTRIATSGFSYTDRTSDRGPEVHAAAMAYCPECGKPSLLYIKAPSKNLDVIRDALAKKTDVINPGFTVVEAYPTIQQPLNSTAWPQQIQKLFRGVQEHHRNSDVPEMTISACRSIMEVAIKDLKGEGRTFKKKISDLKSKGFITKAMEDWGLELWSDGNAAVHEIVGTTETAEQLIDFLKVFLSQVYDLPATIDDKKHPK